MEESVPTNDIPISLTKENEQIHLDTEGPVKPLPLKPSNSSPAHSSVHSLSKQGKFFMVENMQSAESIEEFKPMQIAESSSQEQNSNCMCSKIISNGKSIYCDLCHAVIPTLYQARKERLELMEVQETLRMRMRNEIEKSEMLEKENLKLKVTIEDLKNQLAKSIEESSQMKKDMSVLSEKLIVEVDKRSEVQVEKDKLNEEIEDLTRKLFEEANTMVADEARKRHNVEQVQKSIEVELVKTKAKLDTERTEMLNIRRKFSYISVRSLKGSKLSQEFSQDSHAHTLEIAEPPQPRISLLPPSDTFASIDVDYIPDRRIFDDFVNFYDKCSSIPLIKILSQIPLLKYSMDEHAEPCARLGKLASRKIIDAIMTDTLRVVRVDSLKKQVPSTINASSNTVTRNSPTSSVSKLPYTQSHSNAPSISEKESISSLDNTADRNSVSSSTKVSPTPASVSLIGTTTTISPSKQQFWSGLVNNSTASSSEQPINTCSGCGRSGLCNYQIQLNDSPNPEKAMVSNLASSFANIGQSLNGMFVDSFCHERIFAVWEFIRFVRRVRDEKILTQADSSSKPPAFPTATPISNSKQIIESTSTSRPGSARISTSLPEYRKSEEAFPISITADPKVALLFIEYLRNLKQMFYARLGVLSYFRKIEESLKKEFENWEDNESLASVYQIGDRSSVISSVRDYEPSVGGSVGENLNNEEVIENTVNESDENT